MRTTAKLRRNYNFKSLTNFYTNRLSRNRFRMKKQENQSMRDFLMENKLKAVKFTVFRQNSPSNKEIAKNYIKSQKQLEASERNLKRSYIIKTPKNEQGERRDLSSERFYKKIPKSSARKSRSCKVPPPKAKRNNSSIKQVMYLKGVPMDYINP